MKKFVWLYGPFVLAFLGLLIGNLSAQQKPPPELEAMGGKLMQEINANIQCNANAIIGRAELEKLQAELKALKAKYEPEEKKDAK